MNRIVYVSIALLGGLYLFLLGWSAAGFSSYATAITDFSIVPPAFQQGTMTDTLTVDLQGQGFGSETRVFSHMDINNQSAVAGSFPVSGIVFDMEHVGDLLFIASNVDGFRMLDISEPLKPVMLPRHFLANTVILDIESKGSDLYLSCGVQGVKIREVTADNRLTGGQSLPISTAAVASKVVGRFLYVAADKGGLLVYDLDALEGGQPVATIRSEYPIRGVDSYGGFLYTVASKGGIYIYRILEDGLPLKIGELSIETYAKSITIVDDFLYVVENNKISQYTLRDPQLPQLISEQIHFSSPQKLYHFGDKIYVADNHSGLGIIDNTARNLSEKADFLHLGGDPRAVLKIGRLLYVAVANAGIKIVRLDHILTRQVVSTITTPGLVKDFVFKGDYIYVADSVGGVGYQKVTDPAAVMTPLVTKMSESLALMDDILWVAKRQGGLAAFDLADPGKPKLIGQWPAIASRAVASFGHYLVIANGGEGVELFDASVVSQPRVLDRIVDLFANKVFVVDGLLIVAGEKEGVRFYRIEADRFVFLSRLYLPFPLGRFSAALDIQVVDSTLYVANGAAGVMIADIKNPLAPKILSSISLPGYANALLVEDERVYVLSRFSGLHVIDVADLSSPRVLASISMSDVSGSLWKHDDLLYLGNLFMGVTAIPVPRELQTVDLLSPEHLRVTVPPEKYPGRYSLQISSSEDIVVAEGVLEFQ